MASTALSSETFELVQFLIQSRNRTVILSFLSESVPRTRRECEEELGISRTTVQRNLDALIEQGWVREIPEGYILTACGEFVERVFFDFATAIDRIEALEPFLSRVDPTEFDVDLTELRDARVTASSPENPYAPVNRHVDALETATEFQLMTAVVGREALNQVKTRAAQEGCVGELILSRDALEIVRGDPSCKDTFDQARETESLSLYSFDGELPYYLGLIDGLVQIGVEDDERYPRALLESENEGVVRWARERYSTVKERSTPIP
jgi:predicted transcriptional regulator